MYELAFSIDRISRLRWVDRRQRKRPILTPAIHRRDDTSEDETSLTTSQIGAMGPSATRRLLRTDARTLVQPLGPSYEDCSVMID